MPYPNSFLDPLFTPPLTPSPSFYIFFFFFHFYPPTPIHHSRVVSDLTSHLSVLKSRFEVLQRARDAAIAAGHSAEQSMVIALNNVEYLVRLKVGQDEVSCNFPSPLIAAAEAAAAAAAAAAIGGAGAAAAAAAALAAKLAGAHPLGGAVTPHHGDAVLVPYDLPEGLNRSIREAGGRKVDSMCALRDARRKLLYMAWEDAYLAACVAHEQALARDLNLMHFTGVVRDFLEGGNLPGRVRGDIARSEAGLARLRKGTRRALHGLEKGGRAVEREIEERRGAVEALGRERGALGESVALLEALLAAKGGGGGGAAALAKSKAKMATVTSKAQLAAAVRAQAAEIAALQEELAKLQRRNFVQLPGRG